MKKIFTLFLSFLAASTFGQLKFIGNQKVGFGGAIGQSSLEIQVRPDSTFFILTKGSGNLNDIVVMYVQGNVYDNPTGISSTENFTDHADRFRIAVSGFNGTSQSVLTFADILKPDVAFVFDNNSGAMYSLKENEPHEHLGELKMNSGGTKDASVFKLGFKSFEGAEEGGGLGEGFGFLVTYFSTTDGRSNEFIGDPGPVENPGWGSYISTSYAGFADAIIVPVILKNFTGLYNVSNNNVNLNWLTKEESNMDGYEILSSADGKNFSKIGFVKATNLEVEQMYSYQYANPVAGDNFYKLGIIGKDGHVKFSKIISIKSTIVHNFKAYTTASNRVLKIELHSSSKENMVLKLTNSAGQKIFQSQLKPNGSNNYSIDLNKSLPTGIYSVIISGNGETFNKMIMVQ